MRLLVIEVATNTITTMPNVTHLFARKYRGNCGDSFCLSETSSHGITRNMHTCIQVLGVSFKRNPRRHYVLDSGSSLLPIPRVSFSINSEEVTETTPPKAQRCSTPTRQCARGSSLDISGLRGPVQCGWQTAARPAPPHRSAASLGGLDPLMPNRRGWDVDADLSR